MTKLEAFDRIKAKIDALTDEQVEERRGWPAASWRRLVDIRAAADPHGLFLSPRPEAKAR